MKRVSALLTILALYLSALPVTAEVSEKTVVDKARPKDGLYEQVELFADAISAVRSDYVEEADSKKLIYGAMSGMLASLDDYSQFMEPDEYKEIQVETKGEFGGIGIEISLKDGVLTIITPLAGTPAEAAGLLPNDKIVKIDGKITKSLTLNEAVKLMRGKPGAPVMLTIWRDRNVFDVAIKREIIKMLSIKRADIIDGGIGYIKLVEFQENTASDLDDALKGLQKKGMDSLILDLRNNPGGLLEEAIEVSERFLPKDKMIVSMKARDGKQPEAFRSTGRLTGPDYPLIVMVNEGSASASEIVAGAIKDNKRGIILGSKTFGKASVQTVIPMKDGSALRLTTALYLTPSGKLIKDEGITPDVIVDRPAIAASDHKDDPEDIFDKLEQEKPGERRKENLSDKSKAEYKSGRPLSENDYQLESAVNLMKAMKIYRSQKI